MQLLVHHGQHDHHYPALQSVGKIRISVHERHNRASLHITQATQKGVTDVESKRLLGGRRRKLAFMEQRQICTVGGQGTYISAEVDSPAVLQESKPLGGPPARRNLQKRRVVHHDHDAVALITPNPKP